MSSSGIGTYVLGLRLVESRDIAIGRLGGFAFPAGWYLYVGSALGSGGLRARLARHLRRLGEGKRAHWHIDVLREHATWVGAWACASDQRLECTWTAALRCLPGAEVVAAGFGASDCGCPAHLLWVPLLPSDEWFRDQLCSERVIVDSEELEGLLAILVSDD
ncbi:MAG: GIY-YIG nuclease family protein, partial [Anaerolineae bacterium]